MNNYAIDTKGIGEALQRSAASFNAANTDLSKSIALITGTNEVVQDPEKVGNMWKTVAMRIRGTKSELQAAGEDTEGMVESTSQLREIIQGMTGFDIMEDENTYKDIYDIIVGIGKEFSNLNDLDQASLLEKLAGKMQGNALAAALSNVEGIEAAYQTAEDSAGSAMREQESYEKGISFSIDRMKASFQELSTATLDSGFLKGAVDGATALLDVLTQIVSVGGGIPAIFAGIGGVALFKNLD